MKFDFKSLSNGQLFIFFFALLLGGMLTASRFDVTLTPSLPYRVFYLDRSPDIHSLKKGDYVVFELKSKYFPNPDRRERVMKKITCDNGEALKVEERGYYCGSEYLGRAKEYTMKGEKLKNFIFNGLIPVGHAFVSSRHKDSFDSKYYGFIDKKSVKAKAYPVF